MCERYSRDCVSFATDITARSRERTIGMPPASLRVLLIDNDRERAQSVADELAVHGHEIRIAATASGALDIARRQALEVVILDVSLPDANGYDVANILRRDVIPTGVIIALSELDKAVDVPIGHDPETYIDLHLTKPVDGAELSSLINYVYGKRV